MHFSHSDPPTALIIGAGIGGLAAGLALRRAGFEIRIRERAAAPRELGFGVLLAENALMALRELGIEKTVTAAGIAAGRTEVRRLDGRITRRLNAGLGGRAVVALRSDLHTALLNAVGHDALRLNSEAISFATTDQGVSVSLKDGSVDHGQVLIGADGVNSVIRQHLHPEESRARPSRYCALRGVAFGVGEHLGELTAVAYLDNAIEAATARASVDAVYWYCSLLCRSVITPDPMAIIQARFRDCDPSLRAILAATDPVSMRFDQLWEREPLPLWGSGRVTLLGDAAHPVLPHTGQGAALALEDAVALGLAMSKAPDLSRALRRYEAIRSRRTRALVKLGPRIAAFTTTKNPAIRAVRTLALRALPERVLLSSTRGLQRDPHEALRGGMVSSAKPVE